MANLVDIGAAYQAYGNTAKLPNTQAIESKTSTQGRQ